MAKLNYGNDVRIVASFGRGMDYGGHKRTCCMLEMVCFDLGGGYITYTYLKVHLLFVYFTVCVLHCSQKKGKGEKTKCPK